jgi:xanthine dehydrogenase molybdenum-binding subunit
MGVKNDGTITACQLTNYQNGGAYFTATLGVQYVAMSPINLYPMPAVSWTGYPVYTNWPTAGAKRGYGTPQAYYAFDQHLDVVSEAIGMDPIEFRKKNHVHAGEPFGYPNILSSCWLDECIDQGAAAIGWTDKWRGFGTPYMVDGSKRRAVGFSAITHVAAYGMDAVVVRLQDDGSAQVLTGAADMGQGPTTTLSMICAEALRIPYDNVSIILSDTDAVPYCTGSYASRICCTNGNAVKLASEDALGQLFEVAATLLEVAPEELDAEDGVVFVKAEPDKKLTYAEVMESVFPPVIIGQGRWMIPEGNAIEGFAADFADLEVDVETGEVNILKMVLAFDVGKAINPNVVENQLEGAFSSQGIGMALTEEPVADIATGKVLNLNLVDYHITTHLDVPETECILVELGEPLGPYGAKGCGEIPLTPVGAAVANAVYNAIGVRVTDYPITPAKVLKALGKI